MAGASPLPRPTPFVVKKGSKAFLMTCSLNHIPVSETRISTNSPSDPFELADRFAAQLMTNSPP